MSSSFIPARGGSTAEAKELSTPPDNPCFSASKPPASLKQGWEQPLAPGVPGATVHVGLSVVDHLVTPKLDSGFTAACAWVLLIDSRERTLEREGSGSDVVIPEYTRFVLVRPNALQLYLARINVSASPS